LRFVIEEGTALQYVWAEPGSHQATRRRISPESASRLYDLLLSRQELSKEEVSHVGAFSKVDEVKGTWTLRTRQRNFTVSLLKVWGTRYTGSPLVRNAIWCIARNDSKRL
jgi:hypothetical protein